jgi:hypothetical protein
MFADQDATVQGKRTVSPIDRDPDTHRITRMSLLRERRLLQLAKLPANHKALYSQYYHLQREGLTGWQIGTAYILPAGEERLAALIEQGV